MLTDEELMLLEQLTYLDGSVENAAGVVLSEGDRRSVADIVNAFDEASLERLSQNQVDDYTSGATWAAIIRAIKANKNLMSLSCYGYDGSVFASCYVDPEGKAYVTFRGTSGGNEWYDNAEGLSGADTLSQKEALDYIESLPFDDITVAGHSKGGNKAQYVAILSDKVTRCLSMDGQGFSKEFLEKYSGEITRNAWKIKNYSLSTDYVHILLLHVPGSVQKYFEGPEDVVIPRTHCPWAYFRFFQDEDGCWQLVLEEDGQAKLSQVDENRGLHFLHEFTCFVVNAAPDEKKELLIEYLGNILGLALTGDFIVTVDGKVYTHDDLMAYVFSDQETAAIAIAYLLKFINVYNLSELETVGLLEAMGLKEKYDEINTVVKKGSHGLSMYLILRVLLQLLIGELTDGEKDEQVEAALDVLQSVWLKKWLTENFGADFDPKKLWQDIEKEYKAIGTVNPFTAKKEGTATAGRIYDFSSQTYECIRETMEAVDTFSGSAMADWDRYVSEDWYGSLSVSIFRRGIQSYYSRIADVNSKCKEQMDRIFGDVADIDSAMAGRLDSLSEATAGQAEAMGRIAERLA